ncbi:MAG: transposase, partial [Gammaproteobacteria bacterium]
MSLIKRHLLVDTLGLIQAVVIHEADFQDPEGAWFLIAKMSGRFPRLRKMWADGRYRSLVRVMERLFGCDLEIVRRSPNDRGFVVQPKRWIVERTFGWLCRYRRLTRDYEEQ